MAIKDEEWNIISSKKKAQKKETTTKKVVSNEWKKVWWIDLPSYDLWEWVIIEEQEEIYIIDWYNRNVNKEEKEHKIVNKNKVYAC